MKNTKKQDPCFRGAITPIKISMGRKFVNFHVLRMCVKSRQFRGDKKVV